MRLFDVRAMLDRPAEVKRPLYRDLGRLSVFLFGVLGVTGALLALYYRPSPEGAHPSLVEVTNTAPLGWFVRSLHRLSAHVFVALVGIYILRGFFKRLYLRPRGRTAWRISVGFGFVCLAFLLTGESLPWNQTAYWQTVVNTNLLAEIPLVGHWLANVARGGESVSGPTVVRLYAFHALLLPWIALGLLILARDLRRRGELA